MCVGNELSHRTLTNQRWPRTDWSAHDAGTRGRDIDGRALLGALTAPRHAPRAPKLREGPAPHYVSTMYAVRQVNSGVPLLGPAGRVGASRAPRPAADRPAPRSAAAAPEPVQACRSCCRGACARRRGAPRAARRMAALIRSETSGSRRPHGRAAGTARPGSRALAGSRHQRLQPSGPAWR